MQVIAAQANEIRNRLGISTFIIAMISGQMPGFCGGSVRRQCVSGAEGSLLLPLYGTAKVVP
jgi:hypothetical protein